MKNKCPLPTDESNMYYVQRKWNETIIEIGNVILAGPKAFMYMVGDLFKPAEDPDAEESRKKAEGVLANKKEVESYNYRVRLYEETKLKEREERILKLRERYQQRLKAMTHQDDPGSDTVPDEEPGEEEPQRSCGG